MRRFFRYFYDYRGVCIWMCLSGAVFAVVFAMYGITLEAVWYPLLISALFGAVMLAAGFAHSRRRRRGMEQVLSSEALFSDVTDILPRAGSLAEEDYQALIGKMENAYRAKKGEWDAARRDMADYYATWVHQIKAPIAVMKVMLQQEDTPENRELSAELFRVEQYVEMVLCYFRLDSPSSDFVLKYCSLNEIIRQSIRKFAGQFIQKKLRLIYEPTDRQVLTDEKWLSFVLDQLLSNALKYTSTGSITISVDENLVLSISDTGIGIAPEDLPRIFERSYTGYNGRAEKSSTGLGLYLCRKILLRLSHPITVSSEVGKGSTFSIDLSRQFLDVE